MTKKDVAGILAVLETEYPASFARLSAQQKQAKVNLWADILAKDEAKLVYAAVKSIIAGDRREFAPGIGEIRERMKELTEEPTLSAQEAWALVSRACSNGIYHSQEEFDRLPPIVQATVGSPDQLRQWAMMDSETVQSVVASNFRASFGRVQKREHTEQMLPGSVRELLGGLTERMKLGDGT